jgi:lipopolysaccharide/colanic/teichoic acid biosynthesis glycosyltransferase
LYHLIFSGGLVKRLFDIVVSLSALILLSPVFLFLVWQVREQLGRPVLFKQARPGLCGRPFTLIKFRTMTDERDSDGQLLPDPQRLNEFGRFLRSTSLDELPELWNVLRGDMSIVGPRLLLLDYLGKYTSEQSRRHEVRPGLTGWAQVCGRNSLSWEERFECDVWYLDNQSLWLDLKIIVRTIGVVLRRAGITQEGHVTMEPFRGSVD